jgi:hypothetical protein
MNLQQAGRNESSFRFTLLLLWWQALDFSPKVLAFWGTLLVAQQQQQRSHKQHHFTPFPCGVVATDRLKDYNLCLLTRLKYLQLQSVSRPRNSFKDNCQTLERSH